MDFFYECREKFIWIKLYSRLRQGIPWICEYLRYIFWAILFSLLVFKGMVNDYALFSLFLVLILPFSLLTSHHPITISTHMHTQRSQTLWSLSQKGLSYHNFFSFYSTTSYLKFLLESERLLYSRISPKTKTLVTIAALPSNLLNPQQNAARNA